jgi:ribonuclease R
LSNELCSLKPQVDRLTNCVEFLLTKDGRILESRYYPAVIHSKRRFSYQEVMALLQREPQDDTERMLHHANDLAQKIRRRRFKAGSLDLDFPERKIRLNERGEILRIERVENDVSHQLIEEFMLLANEAVASVLMQRGSPAMYRAHEEPDPLRLQEFREEVLSHHIPCGDLTKRAEVQKLLARLDEYPMGAPLKISFLKSLMRARYSADPLGHYGLAKTKYTHFTSPIRRYADLVVHRLLFNKVRLSPQSLHATADHISETERNSADAERDSKDAKLFAFLKKQLASGQPIVYPAMVIDVRAFGFFVEVPDLAMSGFVHLSTMEDDYYVFDSGRQNLVGRRTRNVIALGKKIEVQIHKIDTYKKQVDFRLAVEGASAPRSAPERQTKSRHKLPPLKPRYFNTEEGGGKPTAAAGPSATHRRPQKKRFPESSPRHKGPKKPREGREPLQTSISQPRKAVAPRAEQSGVPDAARGRRRRRR